MLKPRNWYFGRACRTVLLLAAALFVAPANAGAQGCITSNGTYTCTVPPGTYSQNYSFTAPNSGGQALPMVVTAQGTLTVPTSLSDSALRFVDSGQSGGSSGGGYDGASLTVTNTGSLLLYSPSGVILGSAFGLYSALNGGNGAANTGSHSDDNAGSGADSSASGMQLSLTNFGVVSVNASLDTVQSGGSALYAIAQGGQGGTANGGTGGTGGQSSGATINNQGTINVTLNGSVGFAGIEAIGLGGNGGSGNEGIGNYGGGGGAVSVTNLAPVNLTWTWQRTAPQSDGLYGILAQSTGGNGGSGGDGNGGAGGVTTTPPTASVTLTHGGNVTVTEFGTPPPGSSGAGVAAVVFGGNGGNNIGEFTNGGSGGSAGAPGTVSGAISVADANVAISGDDLPGLLLNLKGGAGGTCATTSNEGDCGGGAGGSAGDGKITVAATLGTLTLSTAGANSPAIADVLQGGVGGSGGPNGGTFSTHNAGNGGSGGNAGAITVDISGQPGAPVTLATTGDNSPGTYAASRGGVGGTGGTYDAALSTGSAGSAGVGGSGGAIGIALTATSVSTSGATSPGVVARSEGAPGGTGGNLEHSSFGGGGNGGNGGVSSNVTVTLDDASSITTRGANASGVQAQSLSGAGGNSGFAQCGISCEGGNGGNGGSTGSVTVTTNGSISTTGAAARGILAQAIAGGGGQGGSAYGVFFGGGGSGASSGAVGSVKVTNAGSIATAGSGSEGILAQSIAGGGGAGGSGGAVVAAVGGSASTNPVTADGGTVNVGTNVGSRIVTQGISAIGILGQSIGGGGGDGGGASGVAVTVGGSGGAGGGGGSVSSTNNHGTIITTTGDISPAFVLQSIGGGGGNAGNASSGAPFTSVAIGGSGGNGGNGGAAGLDIENPTITTIGTKSPGLVVQSIGAGGGTGGNAFAGSVSPGFAVSVAVGGSGGVAGNGGLAQSEIYGGGLIATGQDPLLLNGKPLRFIGACTSLPCNTLPVDDYGVVVQSIGGGGGLGGSASAASLAVAVGTPEAQVAAAVSVALGGTGGSGGAGGAAQFALSSGSRIITSGQGSTAVLAQSIGGGGGTGGDSSALAMAVGYFEQVPEGSSSVSAVEAFSMGGNGGPGGAGGAVGVALGGSVSSCAGGVCLFVRDPVGSAPTSITTFGDFADGVVAQSIGGGGGNAGFGSSNTQAFGTSNNTSMSVTLGSTGGAGGAGGAVQVNLYPGNGITTYGSGAVALMAQSIGGGGGTSQGGSIAVGGSFTENDTNYQVGVNLNLGATGGSGGNGGVVAVSAQAPIMTHGGDATGILAQSIGGGGGLGGSAGADASADNPIVEGLGVRQALSNWGSFLHGDSNGFFASTSTVSIGGSGESGGNGGPVLVQLSAPITTTGDWAHGVVAQSIGGGGGKGGAAAASGTGGLSYVTVNNDIAVGGTGGGGGNGGNVSVNLNEGNTTISTAGFGAAGVIAQSVGGGGGIGADGSDSATGTYSAGRATGSSGGGGGSGGPVSVLYFNPSTTTTITTAGAAADGVVLQSIGGGGGIAGAGSSLFVSAFKQSGTLTLSAGGNAGSGGIGGSVTFGPQPQPAFDTPIVISTTGNDAFGILAQSIGGSGGIVTSQPTSLSSPILRIGGADSIPGGGGGNVSVTLSSQSTITTAGIGAHGIVAQSIGGGGGVIRLVNAAGDSPTINTTLPSSLSNGSGIGSGGSVTVEADGSISVTGAGAVGILAQSVGGGGGLVADGNTTYAGSPNLGTSPFFGGGGTVAVTTNGPVSATGTNGIGIFGQSTGPDPVDGPVSVTVNSSVTGGSGQGSAIQIDSPSGSNANQVTVNAGGSLQTIVGTAGTAILASGGGLVNVTNDGTITGSTYLNGGTLTNNNGGTYNSGAFVQGNLVNSGTVNLGVPGTQPLQTTTVTGSFTQTSSGQLVVTVDSINKAASLLQVDGNATVGGLIVPSAIALLPGTLSVVTAGSLNSSASGLDSLLFNWSVAPSGNTLTLTPSSNFAPRSVGLTASESSLANYLTRAWNNADTAFATRFADFSRLNSGSQYTTLLDAYSGKATEAQSIAFANSAGAILGAAMSCPVFVDQSVLLGEDNCVWVKGSGRWSDQWASGDTQGYHVASATYRLGGQHEIVPNWYLGGSFAAGQTWATTNGTANGSSTGHGQTFDGSLALKHTMGPWFLATSVAIASGSFHSDRLISLPGVSELLQSDPGIILAGARARAGYEFAFNNWYIRPYGDFDVVYTHLSGFQESGPSLYALNVRGSSKTSVVLSPMVEFGGRLILDDRTTLRPFVAVGVSILPNNRRSIDASFVGASADDGTFRSFLDGPGATGDFDVGVQLYRAGGFEVKAEYTANIGGSFASQGASARLAYHF